MPGTANGARRHGSYTVAIICPLGLEMSAMRYMLDREHPSLPPRPDDPNLYILGELSGYNVVLTWLSGNQGKSAAAMVATNLSRTFPAIEWRFLVGTGGGVPSDKHDIRLGDVVISMPEGQYGGVVQYDLGKAYDAEFRHKGFLLPPPTQLRNAVWLMQSNHFLEENQIEEYVQQMLQKGQHLSVYRRPPPDSDALFAMDYAHESGRATCEGCDKEKMIRRESREYAGSEIHYGLIASGDSLMRCAAKRQAIVGSVGDILCFEMEAAGIMSEYPCVVIRGISNYADSHKNDDWQHYAAAAAAAIAKEVLSCIPRNGPEQGWGDEIFLHTAVEGGNLETGRNEPNVNLITQDMGWARWVENNSERKYIVHQNAAV